MCSVSWMKTRRMKIFDDKKANGIDTDKSLLNAPREKKIKKTDLEEETVDEVLRILKSEFEDNE